VVRLLGGGPHLSHSIPRAVALLSVAIHMFSGLATNRYPLGARPVSRTRPARSAAPVTRDMK
jgi:hypothetical protein